MPAPGQLLLCKLEALTGVTVARMPVRNRCDEGPRMLNRRFMNVQVMQDQVDPW